MSKKSENPIGWGTALAALIIVGGGESCWECCC
jgi:hypothetical protein